MFAILALYILASYMISSCIGNGCRQTLTRIVWMVIISFDLNMVFLQYLCDCVGYPSPLHLIIPSKCWVVLLLKPVINNLTWKKYFSTIIQWLLLATGSSQPIINCYVYFKNVTKGYCISMQIMQVCVGLYSHCIHLCLASYLSFFGQVIHLFLMLHG